MNQTKRRPMSPHLQIYRLPLTAIASIMHRISGVAGILLIIMLGFWLWAIATGPAAYRAMCDMLNSWFGMAILFAITASLSFHLLNGIRHLFWDMGWGFTKSYSHRASQIIIVLAILLTAGFVGYFFIPTL